MYHQSHNRIIFLASSSVYRRELLHRLGLEFKVLSPEVDETPLTAEKPRQLVLRLAQKKAAAVSTRHPGAVVIGSDQVAVHDGEILGKPGSAEKAALQLMKFSGGSVTFLTAVSVCCIETGYSRSELVASDVRFRDLSESEIERYVALDKPLDCAGGFKSEAAGSSLLEHLRSDDPTAIIGLPLITVAELLRENGFHIP